MDNGQHFFRNSVSSYNTFLQQQDVLYIDEKSRAKRGNELVTWLKYMMKNGAEFYGCYFRDTSRGYLF